MGGAFCTGGDVRHFLKDTVLLFVSCVTLNKGYKLTESSFSSVRVKLIIFYRTVARVNKSAHVKKPWAQCQAHSSHLINISLSFSSSSEMKHPEINSEMCKTSAQFCIHAFFQRTSSHRKLASIGLAKKFIWVFPELKPKRTFWPNQYFISVSRSVMCNSLRPHGL